MFEGKERRRQLIQELRTTHALQAPEQKIKKQEAQAIEKKQLQERRQLHKVRTNGVVHYVAMLFDFHNCYPIATRLISS